MSSEVNSLARRPPEVLFGAPAGAPLAWSLAVVANENGVVVLIALGFGAKLNGSALGLAGVEDETAAGAGDPPNTKPPAAGFVVAVLAAAKGEGLGLVVGAIAGVDVKDTGALNRDDSADDVAAAAAAGCPKLNLGAGLVVSGAGAPKENPPVVGAAGESDPILKPLPVGP